MNDQNIETPDGGSGRRGECSMTTGPTPDAIALFREAIHAAWDPGNLGDDLCDCEKTATELVESITAFVPPLAEALSLGLAWKAAVDALPEGWAINVLWGTVTEDRWAAHAGPFPAAVEGWYTKSATAGGPTPQAALLALAARLREARG